MRHIHRTQAIAIAGAAALFAASASAQTANDWPSKPVAVVVPFTPGSVADLETRLYAEKLGSNLSKNFIVDNRAGAGAMIGVAYVVKAAPDGYTLLTATSALTIAPLIYPTLGFDPIKDLAYVAMMSKRAPMLIANLKFPPNNGAEYIAYAKANPGKINYGSGGQGTPQNISCELFKMMTGLNMVHVPYRGGAPAIVDLIAGHVQVVFAPISESIQQIKAGKLRALAVTTATRLDVFPDLPTVAEFVPGYEASGFAGIGAPSNTPAKIITMLNETLEAGLADSKIKTRIAEMGGTTVGGSPAEFKSILSEATKKWAKVIKFAGIKAE